MEIKIEEEYGEITSIVINDKYTLKHDKDNGCIIITKNDIYDMPGSTLESEKTDSHNIVFW